eukprot:Awhi_evm1s5884
MTQSNPTALYAGNGNRRKQYKCSSCHKTQGLDCQCTCSNCDRQKHCKKDCLSCTNCKKNKKYRCRCEKQFNPQANAALSLPSCFSATTPVEVSADWIEGGEVRGQLKIGPISIMAYYVPNLLTNLLSLSQMTEQGCEVLFTQRGAITLNGEEIVKFELDKGLWHTTCTKAYKATLMNPNMLHEVLGHASERTVKQIKDKKILADLDVFKSNTTIDYCESCCISKAQRTIQKENDS